MNKNLLPHFLIIGAPKCGTTALHYYLSQHPDLNISPKEIHYFGKDLGYKIVRPSLTKYQSYFKENGLNGDGSVWYLYSDSIYQELKDLGLSPKIIVLLRDPVEVAYALHSQNIVDANENISNFEDALALESERKKGKELPKNVDPIRTLYYKETADFLPRIKLLQANIPEKNIFIGLQNDLKKDTLNFLNKIESFLGVAHFPAYKLDRINENKLVKNKIIHQLIKKPSNLKVKAFRLLIPNKNIRNWIVNKIYNSNLKYTQREKLNESTHRVLKLYFKNMVDELNKIIKPDISNWNK